MEPKCHDPLGVELESHLCGIYWQSFTPTEPDTKPKIWTEMVTTAAVAASAVIHGKLIRLARRLATSTAIGDARPLRRS